MTAHQLMKERDLKERCMYCNRVLESEEWKSHFIVEKHYKVIKCGCGKTNKIHVAFDGTGHDSWHEKKVQLARQAPLEVQVKAMRV